MVKPRFCIRIRDLQVGLSLRVRVGAFYFAVGDVVKVEFDAPHWFVRPTTGVYLHYFLWSDNLHNFEFAEGPW